MSKRNIFIMILVSVLIISICSPVFSAENEKLKVWFVSCFVTDMLNYYKQVFTEFAESKGVEVEFQIIPDVDAPLKFAAAIEGGNPPDIAEFGTPGFIKYASTGQFLDISDLFNKLEKERGGVFDIGKETVTYRGVQYGIPVGFQAQLNHIRKDILEEAGLALPTTYEELFEVAKAVNDPGNNFYSLGQPLSVSTPDSEQWFRGILWSFGGSIVAEDSKTVVLDSQETRKALQWIVDTYKAGLYFPGALGWDGSGNNKAYLSGKTLFIQNAMSVYWQMKSDFPELLEKTIFVPPFEGTQGRTDFGAIFSFAIFKNAKHSELALEALEYFMQKDIYEGLIDAGAGYYVPIFKDNVGMALFSEDQYLKAAFEQIKYSHGLGFPGTSTAEAQEIFDLHILTDMVQRILVDNWSFDKAIKETVDRLEKIYQ